MFASSHLWEGRGGYRFKFDGDQIRRIIKRRQTDKFLHFSPIIFQRKALLDRSVPISIIKNYSVNLRLYNLIVSISSVFFFFFLRIKSAENCIPSSLKDFSSFNTVDSFQFYSTACVLYPRNKSKNGT